LAAFARLIQLEATKVLLLLMFTDTSLVPMLEKLPTVVE
jgi:hypothetical protein